MKAFFENLFNYLHQLTEFNWHRKTYTYIFNFTYFLYFVAFTGIFAFEPSYLVLFNDIIKYYIGIFLIIRYNPFISVKKLTEFDRDIVFSAGIFVLLTTAFANIAQRYLERNIKKVITETPKLLPIT
jgi:pilus assembly protein TadC